MLANEATYQSRSKGAGNPANSAIGLMVSANASWHEILLKDPFHRYRTEGVEDDRSEPEAECDCPNKPSSETRYMDIRENNITY